jgi:hypothetical protein
MKTKSSEDYINDLTGLMEHPDLRGYLPSVLNLKDSEVSEGVIERCIPVDEAIEILSGILRADREGAIKSPELMHIVPHVKRLYRAHCASMRNSKALHRR